MQKLQNNKYKLQTTNNNLTYAIVRRFKESEKSSIYRIVDSKLYDNLNLANATCLDLASREDSERVSFTVVFMPFNHI